ncbi:hypothetical protein MNBD_PLANCTO02-249 [hydrothermal vent metagenome]|uniref:Alpha/beta hydrolase n=1 Tax=hydrothermal vent metagenome TaxID=652676 RepID=A0A3B1DTK7_9ZZZZ
MRIASSRSLPQHATRQCQQKSLSFYYTDVNSSFHSINPNSFYQSFQPGVPICIFVHGSYMNWEDIPVDSASVRQWVQAALPQQQTQIIYYTWHSQMSLTTVLPHIDTSLLGHKSAFNGLYLARMISQLPQNCPITLIGHSFGCRTISSALHLLGGGEMQGIRLQRANQSQHRIRVLFTAAPVDHNWFNPNERYSNALKRAEHIINLKTRKDWALSLYPFRRLFSRRSLGRRGWSKKDYIAMGELRHKISEYDVTCRIGTGHGWPFYAKQHDLARFLGKYIYFAEEQYDKEGEVSQQSLRQRSTPVPLRPPLRENYVRIRSRH